VAYNDRRSSYVERAAYSERLQRFIIRLNHQKLIWIKSKLLLIKDDLNQIKNYVEKREITTSVTNERTNQPTNKHARSEYPLANVKMHTPHIWAVLLVNSAFHPSGVGKLNRVLAYWPGLRRGAFTCVGWQVTLCDPMRQVTPRSYVMGLVSIRAINCALLIFLTFLVERACVPVIQETALLISTSSWEWWRGGW